MAETSIEMARRHIREGEVHIADQRAMVDRLKQRGADPHLIAEAETLLMTFLSLQDEHEQHLRRLMRRAN